MVGGQMGIHSYLLQAQCQIPFPLPFDMQTPPLTTSTVSRGLPLIAQLVKNPPAMQETQVQFLGWEDPLEHG